jgi:hypothetical protein
MTKPVRQIRNVFCTDEEDRVIPWSCSCCVRCWMFVASLDGAKNGKCPFGGPFGGYEKDQDRAPSPVSGTPWPDRALPPSGGRRR